MAFTTINPLAIQVGSAVKKDLWDVVKDDLDDLNTRVNAVEASAPKIKVIEFYCVNASSFQTATGIYYYKSVDNFTLTSAFIQIFEKGSLTGTFQADILKSTTNLDGPSFSTVFTTKPSINFATAVNYETSTNQVFDPTKVSISVGNYLRLDLTQLPTSGVMSKFLITVYGE